MGLKIKGAYSAILSKKSLKDENFLELGKKSMNGKNHSLLIKIFLNWYTSSQFWFKLRKEVVTKMVEVQFDLCFSSDWESDGSYKDPPYLPEKDEVSSFSDSDSDEIQFKEKGISVKR